MLDPENVNSINSQHMPIAIHNIDCERIYIVPQYNLGCVSGEMIIIIFIDWRWVLEGYQ